MIKLNIDKRSLAIHVLCWGLIFFVPSLLRPSERLDERLLHTYRSLGPTLCYMAVFYLNHLYLIPRLYLKHKRSTFFGVNLLLLLVALGVHTGWWWIISDFLPDTPDTHMLKIVTATLNGDYNQDNFNAIAATGLRNEGVMLLAMKRNEEALKVSRQLPDDEALTHYLRAVCLNRLEQMSDAYDELTKAIQMDPSLKQVAHTDGDVNDLLLDSNDNN